MTIRSGYCNMDDFDRRLIEAEWNIAAHTKELRCLKETFQTSISSIQRTLDQIKWVAIGAAISLIVTELGLLESLTLLAGL